MDDFNDYFYFAQVVAHGGFADLIDERVDVALRARTTQETEKGGHFASLEQPEIFVRELRAAFRKLR